MEVFIFFAFVMFALNKFGFIGNKKKKSKQIKTRKFPKTHREYQQHRKGKGRNFKPSVDAKLKEMVKLTQRKKAELSRKKAMIETEINNLTINTKEDEAYQKALFSGLSIIDSQIAKVEESYAHLELTMYNKHYQKIIKTIKQKNTSTEDFQKANRAINNLLKDIKKDVVKYNPQYHPRAIEEYTTLINEISTLQSRLEQLRRKSILNDISMSDVYDEDRKNDKSFSKLNDLFENLDADKSIQQAMEELEVLEEEMQRLNAESEVLRRYGDTL